MKRAIYPGSFDPVTFGHLDIIRRAAAIFDGLVVGVASNAAKEPLFPVQERITMITRSVGDLPNVEVREIQGLLVDFCRETNCHTIIRGLRANSDFEYEFQMALMNRRLAPELETLFLTPQEEHTFVSSRLVKEVAHFNGDVSSFVPPHVIDALREKFPPHATTGTQSISP